MTSVSLRPDRSDDREPAADAARARKKAMDYLARREHGRHELLEKVEAAGFDRETAAAAIDVLAREGLQDDQRFVDNFVQSRINQGKGPVRIRAELRQHGVEGPLVDESLAGSGEDWAELARRIRVRKFGGGRPAGFPEKARQMRFLQYRGFEPDDIRRAMDDPE